MRTLATQVKLRRLVRAFAEARERLASEPSERRHAGILVERLLELAADLRASWAREADLHAVEAPLDAYVEGALRTIGLAIAGLAQAGAELDLLRSDFELAALPLEMFLRGLEAQPALRRSA